MSPEFSVPEFSLRYHLDWRDALAWETLPSELGYRQKAVYLGILFSGCFAYGLAAASLPDWINALPEILPALVVVAVMHGVWMIYFAAQQRRRARKRLPHQTKCVFEDWGDHIYIHTEFDEVSLSADLCQQTVVTPTHLFIDFGDTKSCETLVIVPTAAFDSPDQCFAFVAKWQRLADEARD